MKVFLFLIVWLAGNPEPIKDHAEVADIKTCHAELGKLLAQPLPRELLKLQAGCFVMKDGVPAE